MVGNVRNEALVSRIVEKTELSISGWNLEFNESIFAYRRQVQGQSCVFMVRWGVDRLYTHPKLNVRINMGGSVKRKSRVNA